VIDGPDLPALLADPARALEVPPGEAMRLLMVIAPVTEALRLAAAAPTAPVSPEPATNGDELLTADEVAALLKKPRHAIYSMLRTKALAPAVLRINRRTLRVRKEELMRRLPRA
jgi:hypothetical protein